MNRGHANEAVKRGWRPAFKLSAQPATVAGIATVRTEQRASDWDQAAWEAGAPERAQLKQSLLRKGAG